MDPPLFHYTSSNTTLVLHPNQVPIYYSRDLRLPIGRSIYRRSTCPSWYAIWRGSAVHRTLEYFSFCWLRKVERTSLQATLSDLLEYFQRRIYGIPTRPER
ncbi:hypothetical protein WG66_014924 [Moniliophthora roreri]|nr:hypothetical protein WG66_014924 [Moniliophthora roreri]